MKLDMNNLSKYDLTNAKVGDNKKYKCHGDCVKAIKRLYSQLKASEGENK